MGTNYYLVCSVCGSKIRHLGKSSWGGIGRGNLFASNWANYSELVKFLSMEVFKYGSGNICVKTDSGEVLEVSSFVERLKKFDGWVLITEDEWSWS